MKKKQRNIIAFIMKIPPGTLQSIKAYERREKRKFRIMLLRDVSGSLREEDERSDKDSGIDSVISCDFSSPARIAEALAPYQDELCAITCRAEAHIARFIQIIPHVPYLRTPTTESLRWATDKLEMRRRFRLLARKYNPLYAVVKDDSKVERKRIINKIGFPLIVKPTNLAQSMLVSICYHEEEFERCLKHTFRKIERVYAERSRIEEPKVIAEQFIEGDLYSVDAYVNGRGHVYFCPLVRVITGKSVGHTDDFTNYIHMSPTGLKKRAIEAAETAATAGIHALGLRNTTAHIELMKHDDEWRLIEIGPRVGGFRDKLHMLSCGIDHALNDILIRLPKKPVIPKKCHSYAATLKWYPKREGVIGSMKGIKKVQELKSFVDIKILRKIGDRFRFAKNGGTAVFTLTLAHADRSVLLADIRRVEKLIDISIL